MSTTLVTTQMLTQMLLATVSLCVLCETVVRSRPQRHGHARLMRSESHARAQLSAKSAEAWKSP